MTNIVDFPDQTDLKRTSYIDYLGEIGISTRDRRLEIVRLNDREFEVITPDGSQLHDRDTLAELLWVAAALLDSKEQWRPEMNLIGCNYEEKS